MKSGESIFICDFCKTPIESLGFPYGKNWVYFHEFNIQRIGDDFFVHRIFDKDKHFCCDKCLIKYINKKIKSAEGHIVTDIRKCNGGNNESKV